MCSSCKSYFLPSSSCRPTLPPNITPSDTGITDTGDRGIYLIPKAPCANINPTTLQVVVGIDGGPPHSSSASCNVNIPIPVTKIHLMSNFLHNMMGIGPLCDHGCCVLFEKKSATPPPKDDTIILRVWRESSGPSCGGSPSAPKIIQ